MNSTERLYTPELLSLAVGLSDHPWIEDLPIKGSARSKSCGSTLALGLELDPDGSIRRIGMKVHACAVGQASAAIFANAAIGCGPQAIAKLRVAVREWIAGSGTMPDWPGIDLLDPARAFPARHGAMILSWEAAHDALSRAQPSG